MQVEKLFIGPLDYFFFLPNLLCSSYLAVFYNGFPKGCVGFFTWVFCLYKPPLSELLPKHINVDESSFCGMQKELALASDHFFSLLEGAAKNISRNHLYPVPQSPVHLLIKCRKGVEKQPSSFCSIISQLPHLRCSTAAIKEPCGPLTAHLPISPCVSSFEGEALYFSGRYVYGYFIKLFCLILKISLNHDRAHYHRMVSDAEFLLFLCSLPKRDWWELVELWKIIVSAEGRKKPSRKWNLGEEGITSTEEAA